MNLCVKLRQSNQMTTSIEVLKRLHDCRHVLKKMDLEDCILSSEMVKILAWGFQHVTGKTKIVCYPKTLADIGIK